ncbi:MAG: hypothetical protein M3170_01145 [Candidatus Dormibacteraeota bacterium]|nr:hypothetical protein [Candidatus Dormibacteraeota bacterium]MDQ6920189.1 hypothetical protein [Candidatus Dormibacteraeota bacterium]
MRTLQTQMRVRRALRVEAEYRRRLVTEGHSPDLARAGAARLLHVLRDVRTAWNQESADLDVSGLRGHVSRWLSAMEAAAAGLERPGADLGSLSEQFRDAGVPLVFFLRGLDDSSDPVLAELTGSVLERSA